MVSAPERPRESADVLVVGGGPAGLAAAIACRLAGLDVALVEKRLPPVDKACGEGIMPDGARVLEDLGVVLPEGSYFPFHGITYLEGETRAAARFTGRSGIGVRRTVLHNALVARAAELGVRLFWGTRFRRTEDETLIGQGIICARFLVAADGADSPLRRELGLDRPPRSRRIGIRRHVQIAPWSDSVEVHWSDACEVYVTPVARDQVCVAVLSSDSTMRFDEAVGRFPALGKRLFGAAASGADRGSPTYFRSSRKVVLGNVALLGDAAGCVDAITGEGVSLALHQSVALASAIASGDLRLYARSFRKIQRFANGMTAMMLAIHGRPRMRRLTIAALGKAPPVFSGILSLLTWIPGEARSEQRRSSQEGVS